MTRRERHLLRLGRRVGVVLSHVQAVVTALDFGEPALAARRPLTLARHAAAPPKV
jgi:hypothetical protein